MHVQRAFLYNLYEHHCKFPFVTLFGERKHRDKFNLLSPNLGVVPKTHSSSPIFAILRELTEINAKKQLGTFSFPALAVVVAKAPHIHESDTSILVLLQTRMIKCGKVSG